MEGPVVNTKKNQRITWIGVFLRKTNLDELPQLFNVRKDEMSLAGQRRRLSMKPGLTRIWQVSGGDDVSGELWMDMDLEFIDNWSLKLDQKLLLLTVKEVTIGEDDVQTVTHGPKTRGHAGIRYSW